MAELNFTTELDIDSQSEDDFEISNLLKFMWITLYWSTAIAGTIGNVVVIWVVVAHKNMRTVTNLFLLNLAVADGLVATLNIPFVSFQLIFNYWPFGSIICQINEFIAATSICVSVLTLSMIAIDRYTAIMYPFKLRMGRGKTITIMILMWIVSIVVTAPNWLYIQQLEIGYETFACFQIWPEDAPKTPYRIIFMIVTYFLPLTCMAFSYGRLGSILWGSTDIGEKSENQLKKDLAKKKIVKMMIMIVVIFTICWLPFHIYFILNAAGLLYNAPPLVIELYTLAFWLAMSNSMYNPMVYCWMNSRFRAGFKKAFRWCPCVHYDMAQDAIHFPTGTERKSIVTEAD